MSNKNSSTAIPIVSQYSEKFSHVIDPGRVIGRFINHNFFILNLSLYFLKTDFEEHF